MRAIPALINVDLHRLAMEGSIVALLSIPEHTVFKARSLVDIVWNGDTYEKFWFELDVIEDASTGSIPELNIAISNVGGFVEEDVIDHDNYEDSTCIITLVDSEHLDETTPINQWTFNICKVSIDNTVVRLKITAENPLLYSYPAWSLHGSICQYDGPIDTDFGFKGSLCKYSGEDSTCDRTLEDCLSKSNSKNFGAQLGLKGQYIES